MAGVPDAAARGRRGPPAAELDVGGAHRGGRARASTSSPSPTGSRRLDPASAVKPPTPAKRLPKALPLSDVEAILEAAGAPDTTLALRDRALLEVLYGTGARISEAVGLDIDDLDTVDGTVLLRGKGSQGAAGAGRRLRARRRAAYLTRARPELVAAAPGRPGDVPQLPRRPAVAPERLGGAGQGRRAGRGHRVTSPRTRCATRSPPTCSTAAPTSASSRSSSGTRPSPRRRSTPWSPSTTCARSSPPRTPERGTDPASGELAEPGERRALEAVEAQGAARGLRDGRSDELPDVQPDDTGRVHEGREAGAG